MRHITWITFRSVLCASLLPSSDSATAPLASTVAVSSISPGAFVRIRKLKSVWPVGRDAGPACSWNRRELCVQGRYMGVTTAAGRDTECPSLRL